MLGDLQQSRVAKRHNCTLMDMVRIMLSYSMLPISLWMEALKTVVHIIEYQVSGCLKHRTNYGRSGNQH
jgi:hypothetical protein